MEYCKKCGCPCKCCSHCHCCPCCCLCPPHPIPKPASFTVTKRDETTHAPLADASYTLYKDGQPIAAAVSGVTGELTFSGLTPGEYQLVETQAPPGHQPETGTHLVTVSADGRVTIDGRNAQGFSLFDKPDMPDAILAFPKVDAVTGQPVPGAVFTLPNGVTATSGSDGIVNFGQFGPGVYIITESKAPDGYEPDPNIYTVVVSEDNRITVNGIPLENFSVENTPVREKGPIPALNSILEGDSLISGNGIPGAAIDVTFPDGSKSSAIVNGNGIWLLPSGRILKAGQIVTAVQTVTGHTPSDEAAAIVQHGN